jgi:hypothetical protein
MNRMKHDISVSGAHPAPDVFAAYSQAASLAASGKIVLPSDRWPSRTRNAWWSGILAGHAEYHGTEVPLV